MEVSSNSQMFQRPPIHHRAEPSLPSLLWILNCTSEDLICSNRQPFCCGYVFVGDIWRALNGKNGTRGVVRRRDGGSFEFIYRFLRGEDVDSFTGTVPLSLSCLRGSLYLLLILMANKCKMSRGPHPTPFPLMLGSMIYYPVWLGYVQP